MVAAPREIGILCSIESGAEMQETVGKEAFGKPGIEPRWTHSNKAGIGTAYSASSHLWFTVWNGIVTELYYPTVDRPQLRDLEYLVTDGKTFFHEEKRDLNVRMERISDHALGYPIIICSSINAVVTPGRSELLAAIECDSARRIRSWAGFPITV
jgi:hypothetical protein